VGLLANASPHLPHRLTLSAMTPTQAGRRRFLTVHLAIMAMAAATLSAPSALAQTDSVTFAFGQNGTWQAPAGVTNVTVEVAGGGGGGVNRTGITGGNGALVRASVDIQAGETLTIGVGGRGSGNGSTLSSGGGGGGGGASIITSSIAERNLLIIAGGGGGAGGAAGSSGSGGSAGVFADGKGADGGQASGNNAFGRGGGNGTGGSGANATDAGRNYVLGSGTDNGSGGGSSRATVAGSGSSGANQVGGRGGAGFGGGSSGTAFNDGAWRLSGGGAGGSVAQGTGVQLVAGDTQYFSSAGGAGGVQASSTGQHGWVMLTWDVPPAPDPDPVLTITRQPSSTAQSGEAFESAAELTVTEDGTTSPLGGVTVSVSIGSAPSGTSSLIGDTTGITSMDGSVFFGTLGISGPAGSYTLIFSAAGASSVTSSTITVSADPDPDPTPDPTPVPTPVVSPPPSDYSGGNYGMLTLEFPNGLTCNTNGANTKGLWIQLPSADQCSIPGDSARPLTQLLGWATTPEFPIAIARRQVTNGWGAYEMTNDHGQITAVFIPAGGWTAQSAPGMLFPIIDIAG